VDQPPIPRFLACADATELTPVEIQQLLDDYKRLSNAVLQLAHQ
jgi:hypothetical protein